MLRRSLAMAVLLVVAGAARAGDPPSSPVEDLSLVARLLTDADVVPGEPVRIGARLVNRSEHASHAVVRPGDGSECGWREPHVFFTAVRRTSVGDVPVEAAAWGRCGNADPEWQDDVITLGPGDVLDLTPAPASIFLDFQQEGETAIRLHYAWTGGKAARGDAGQSPTADLGTMEGVAPFELVSDPVVVHVHRPVDVRLERIGSLVVGEAKTLADLLRVTVENRTDQPLDFRPQMIQFVLGETTPPDLLDRREDIEPSARVKAAPIPARSARTYEGVANFALLRHLRLRAAKPGTLRLAAVYAPGAVERGSRRSRVRIRSPWIEIPAKPRGG